MLEERLKICEQCPLWKDTEYGPICNPHKWINPKDGRSSFFPKDGYVQGCNCRIKQKASNIDSHCIAGK